MSGGEVECVSLDLDLIDWGRRRAVETKGRDSTDDPESEVQLHLQCSMPRLLALSSAGVPVVSDPIPARQLASTSSP